MAVMIKRIAFPIFFFPNFHLFYLKILVLMKNKKKKKKKAIRKTEKVKKKFDFLFSLPVSPTSFLAIWIVFFSWLFLTQQILFCSSNSTLLSKRGIFPFQPRINEIKLRISSIDLKSARNRKSKMDFNSKTNWKWKHSFSF